MNIDRRRDRWETKQIRIDTYIVIYINGRRIGI